MSDVNWSETGEVAGVLRDASTDLDRLIGAGSPGTADIAEMAKVLHALDESLVLLHDAREVVHAWVAQMMESNDQHVPGVGDLHRDWSRSSRKDWKHEEVRHDALAIMRERIPARAVNPDTGERVHSWGQAIEAISALYNLAGYNVRISQLKMLGLDSGDYCREGPWKPSVTITPEREANDE